MEEVSVGVVPAAQQNAAAGRLMAESAEELVNDAEELRALVGRVQI